MYEILAVNGSIPANPTIKTLGGGFGFKNPVGVAVDQYGNVFVADQDAAVGVAEIVAPNYTTVIILGSGFIDASGVAVDGNGNVYVADSFNGAVKEILALSYTTVNTLASGFVNPSGVAVDGKGNVYVADFDGPDVTKLDFADPPSLSFATTAEGSTSTDSPKTVTVENGGNATLTFPTPATGTIPIIPSGYRLDYTTTCPQLSTNSSPGTLDPGDTCAYAVDFSPIATGNFSGSLVLTDNNLNAPSPSYATQSIALSGTATAAVSFALTNSGNINVTLGGSGTTTITVTPVGGFTGSCCADGRFHLRPTRNHGRANPKFQSDQRQHHRRFRRDIDSDDLHHGTNQLGTHPSRTPRRSLVRGRRCGSGMPPALWHTGAAPSLADCARNGDAPRGAHRWRARMH